MNFPTLTTLPPSLLNQIELEGSGTLLVCLAWSEQIGLSQKLRAVREGSECVKNGA